MLRRCLDTGTPFGVVLIRDGRESGRSKLALAGVGTMAAIREVNQNGDGTFDILSVGTRRFRLLGVDPTREPYLVGEVAELDEPEGDVERAQRLASTVSDRFIRYVELVSRQEGRGDTPAALELLGAELGSADDLDTTPEAAADEEDDEGADDDDAPTLSLRVPEVEEPAEDEDGSGERVIELTIPDDPTRLSYLLGGILAVEPVRRQELLEAPTAEARLALLRDLLEREILLLGRNLETYVPDPRLARAARN